MAEVNYTDLLNGLKLAANTIYSYFQRLNGVDSLSMINGRLDAANLNALKGVDYNLIQKNAQSSAGVVAGTRNLDFFGGTDDAIQGWFDGIGDTEAAADDRWIPIPGASIQFRLDYPSYILLTWHVSWVSDHSAENDRAPDGGAQIRLFINGKPADGGYVTTPGPDPTDSPQVRATGRCFWLRNSATSNERYLRDRYKSRFWCGHKWIGGKSKGWHSASLRVCADQVVKQTRVRARSMKYIAFKRGDT
mgnify:CR=1 FL=1|jgi:hypothetical protein|tara:strand:- start:93 stop:836 length:744 start_codon:yes stop_codon:yes gene_type:complete